MSEATEVVEAKPQDIATLPPAERAQFIVVDELGDTGRGEGGFGSTGA